MKRALDLFVSVLLLVVLSPLFVVLSVLIMRAGGSPIYGHVRIGCGGRLFPCYKFRSMVPDAAERLQALLNAHPELREEWERDFKLKDDPRITKIGKFLRKTSLDELPQLFNVILGQMSLVGPRPVVVEELERYGDAKVEYLSVRPGMTGLWQVSGRNNVDYSERVALDSEYIRRQSLAMDLRILFQTAWVVFHGHGAY